MFLSIRGLAIAWGFFQPSLLLDQGPETLKLLQV